MISLPEHEFFRELSEEERIDFLADLIVGALSLGIPEAYMLAEAIYYGDEEQFWYSLRVTVTIHSLYFAAWQINLLYDALRHGGRHTAGYSFHRIMQASNILRTHLLKDMLFRFGPTSFWARFTAFNRFANYLLGMYAMYEFGTIAPRVVSSVYELSDTHMRTHIGGNVSFRNPISGM